MTDQPEPSDLEETPQDASQRTLDVAAAETRSIEVVDPSPMLRHLIEIAQHLGDEDLRKLLLRARRMLRGQDE